jgi:hypothetical protein
MVGILVHGDNHFIVRGPFPCRETALALVRHWSVIRIGAATPPALAAWQIRARSFARISSGPSGAGESAHSAAVVQLLGELRSRGIVIHDAAAEEW